MADDPVNQAQFAEDVAAAGEGGKPFVNYGDPNAQMPNPDEIWKMIEGMEGISDADRETIRENLYNPASAEEFMRRLAGGAAGGEAIGPQHTSMDYIIFFVMIAIVLLVFALFGYKLYKSAMAKELKKQQKLKLKQSKKKKAN